MIFYFTGTGNSLWVAKELEKMLHEPLISIPGELKKNEPLTYSVKDNEKIVFVYPVHSWGLPVLVARFIAGLTLEGYHKQPVYSVCTCGDECGNTDRIIRKALYKRGISLTGCYSIIMPNNYILMKGFNVDSKEVEEKKLLAAPLLLDAIISTIEDKSKIQLYNRGMLPFTKSYLIYPLFTHFAVGKNSFYATDACNGCGLCVKRCPTGTIALSSDGKPVWGKECVQCVACIHGCPVQAVEYGRKTQSKGRYHHPDWK